MAYKGKARDTIRKNGMDKNKGQPHPSKGSMTKPKGSVNA